MSLSDSFIQQLEYHLGSNRLLTDKQSLITYGTDWTKIYTPNPSAVIFPQSSEEVSVITTLCSEANVAIVPSGGRTGLAGGAVAQNSELVVSLKHLTSRGELDHIGQTLQVGAGTITQDVHDYCQNHDLTWPIDLAAKGSCQIGGNIATNAGGVRVVRYGLTRNWVLGLKVVTMQGEVLDLLSPLEKNNTGLDLRQLFIGSEGVLGLITEATLKLTTLPKKTCVILIATTHLPDVMALFQAAKNHPTMRLNAFEYIDPASLTIVSQQQKLKSPFNKTYDAYVLLELDCPPIQGMDQILEEWLDHYFESGLIKDAIVAHQPSSKRELWAYRENISESLSSYGLVYKNDVSIPIAKLPAFVADTQSIFKQYYQNFELFLYGHVGDGNLHINIVKPETMSKEDFIQHCHQADQYLFQLIQSYRGSVSAEHGIGLLKRHALPYSRSPQEIQLFRKIKTSLDPQNLLNPGKVLTL